VTAGSRSRLGIALAIVAGTLAGCGSSVESRSDFVARANAVCETAVRDVRDVTLPAASGRGGTSLSALSRYLQTVTPVVQGEVKQLRALPRPAADRALLDQYLNALASSAAQYRVLDDAARHRDRAALAGAIGALRASPAAQLAARYGLAECAGSAGTAATS
jgi:hypothetical protein